MLKFFRYILFPFSIVWGFVIWVRNKLFDKNILRSASFNFPLICVGNLTVGGTGKTPMTEYLIRVLENNAYKVATLSRGYKRKTKGFIIADKNASAIDIGDEPMQMHKKFPDLTVAVHEERILGIPQLLGLKPATKVIILDDAFQHREVKAGMNILLTAYENLYIKDYMLPTGNLRDVRSSSKRANIIIVSKCKPDLNEHERQVIIQELNPLVYQKIFFTKIEYATPYHLFTNNKRTLAKNDNVLLVCGIAKPQPLQKFLASSSSLSEMLLYKDHHIFGEADIEKVKDKFSKIKSPEKIIITTEKDAVRFEKYQNILNDFPIYVIPIRHTFLFNEENEFEQNVISFVKTFTSANTDDHLSTFI